VLALLWSIALASFALATNYWLALGLLFAAGFFELAFNAMAQTLVQLQAPVDIRGRVIGLFNMASLGLRAFSGVSVGLVGGLIGVHRSLALSALIVLAIAGLVLTIRAPSRISRAFARPTSESRASRFSPASKSTSSPTAISIFPTTSSRRWI